MMKKILLMLVATVSVMLCAQAMPAYPNPVKVTQPDGSQITIQLFGDEHFHWAQTTDGYNVIQREDGYYYYDAPVLVRAHDVAQRGAADREVLSRTRRGMPSEATAAFQHAAMLQQTAEAHNQHTREVIQRAPGDKFHSLVILVNFSDRAMVIPNTQQAFSQMLNEDGYSVNNGNGSAWNYYMDNSNGRFDGSFDVYGPFTIDQTMLSHGGGTSNMQDFLEKACVAAKAAGVNFASYADDGIVRDIFFFFAGYDRARGAASGSIWSHRGYTNITFDGVKVSGYACTSELTNTSGSTMAAIGTFCHEFGHVLGWPDLYDTDYETNGSALHPSSYSLMAAGGYNNNSHTPPALMAMERDMLGWLDATTLTTSGDYTLPHVSSDKAYKILTGKDGEYFWLETRGSTNKWDKGFSSSFGGMLVMHVDRSTSYLSRWGIGGNGTNRVNAYSAHPCFMPIRASSTGTSTTEASASTAWLFGSNGKIELNSNNYPLFKPWSSSSNNWTGPVIEGRLTNIAYNNGQTSFTFTNMADITLDDVTVAVLQNDAIVSWESTWTGQSKVELQRGSEAAGEYITDGKSAYLPMLTANTTYTATVYPIDGTGKAVNLFSETKTFRTTVNTSEFVAMGLMKGTFAATEQIPLRVINLPANMVSMEWQVDGKVANVPAVTLEPGKHVLRLTLVYNSDREEVITKTITVK